MGATATAVTLAVTSGPAQACDRFGVVGVPWAAPVRGVQHDVLVPDPVDTSVAGKSSWTRLPRD